MYSRSIPDSAVLDQGQAVDGLDLVWPGHGVGQEPGEHRDGQVCAQQVLSALAGGGGRAEAGADAPLGDPEPGFEDGDSGGQQQPDDAGFRAVTVDQPPGGLGGDVGG